MDPFDFGAFRAAYGGPDPDAWAAFYAEDAEWIEYRYSAPPAAPHRMEGRERIRVVLEQVVAAGRRAELSEVIHAPGRAAFRVDVEAWDPAP